MDSIAASPAATGLAFGVMSLATVLLLRRANRAGHIVPCP